MNRFIFTTESLNEANKLSEYGDIIEDDISMGLIINKNPLIIEIIKSVTERTATRLQNKKLWIWDDERLLGLDDQDIIDENELIHIRNTYFP